VVKVAFTPNLRRHAGAPTVEVAAGSLVEVLGRVFAEHPQLRGYVLDEQGALRHHMVVFVDGRQVDRTALDVPVPDGGEVYVMQALSGGTE
jgi:sulfur-carrier protein